MANGFISSTGIMMAGDIADEIINEVCWASFFQDIEKDEFGNIMGFKIHDLLHDLVLSVRGDVCRNLNNESSIEHPKIIRHLRIDISLDLHHMGLLRQVESLRTHCGLYYPLSSSDILRIDSLRALDVRYLMDTNKLLSSSTHFKHLRYLNLAGSDIERLPESISSLCNLQVLNHDYCSCLQVLPHHLKCLKALRHLHLRWCTSLSRMSHEMGQLTFLRTSNIYIVGRGKGFWLAELGNLGLQGQLHIKNLERVRSFVDAKEANLMDKQLDELFLSWGRNGQSELQQNVEKILEAHEPHPKVVSVGVGGYKGGHFPHWMGNPTLKYLSNVKLVDCRYSLQLPQLGKLPSLKELKIHNMHHVQYVNDESYHEGVARGFPSLESLLLSYMPNLEGLSKQGENMFPYLSKLSIAECPKLTLPSLQSVRKLTILKRCDKLSRNSVSPLFFSRLPSTNDPIVGSSTSNQILLDSIHNLHGLEFLCFFDDQSLLPFQ